MDFNTLDHIHVPAAFNDNKVAVERYELELEEKIAALASRAAEECAKADVQILALSGPTCAGKTTAAKKLTEELIQRGYSVHIVSLDDFYYDHETLHKMAAENGGVLDYDSVNVMDLPLLQACIDGLASDGYAEVPVYDFERGTNDTRRVIKADPSRKNVYFFEGIQAVYPEISPMLRHYRSKSMFISVMRGIDVGGVCFSPVEIRLCRRIVRDADRRGSTPDFTLSLWHSVRANEENAIFPYAGECDYFVDTTLGYELHMLRPFLEPLLCGLSADCGEFEIAMKLLEKIKAAEPVPSALLPQNSLYNEFITPVVS